MDDPHVVQVLYSIQDLVDELAGISLCVEAFLYDPVEQLTAGNAGNRAKLKRKLERKLHQGDIDLPRLITGGPTRSQIRTNPD